MEEKKKIVIFEDDSLDLEMDYEFAKDCDSYVVVEKMDLVKDYGGKFKEAFYRHFMGDEEVSRVLRDVDYYFVDGLNGKCFHVINYLGLPQDKVYVVSSNLNICEEAEKKGLKLGYRGAKTLEEAIRQ